MTERRVIDLTKVSDWWFILIGLTGGALLGMFFFFLFKLMGL